MTRSIANRDHRSCLTLHGADPHHARPRAHWRVGNHPEWGKVCVVDLHGRAASAPSMAVELRSACCQLVPSVTHAQGQALPSPADDVPVHHGPLLDTGLDRRGRCSGCRRVRQVSDSDRQNYSDNDSQKNAHVPTSPIARPRPRSRKRTDAIMVRRLIYTDWNHLFGSRHLRACASTERIEGERNREAAA
jgi:hypothetical protein